MPVMCRKSSPKGFLNMIAKLTIKSLCAMEAIKRGLRDDEGAALVEYGLLVGFIALACVVAITLLGTKISGMFTGIANKLPQFP